MIRLIGTEILPRVSKFDDYVDSVSELLATSVATRAFDTNRIEMALDGEPGRALREHYSVSELRASGTFLTGPLLADRLADHAVAENPEGAVLCDPACGAGDLLIAAARHFPVDKDLVRTLQTWGQRLAGFDTQPSLARLTKLRLALLAVQRGAVKTCAGPLNLERLFPMIQVRSGLESWNLPPVAIIVMINPPFTRTAAPPACGWATGSVSQAAVFLERCLKQFPKPHYVYAILPDVLRTGSRYQKWRKLISDMADVSDVARIGLFDRLTDVDVFTVKLSAVKLGVNGRTENWAMPSINSSETVGDRFSIRVGSVVAYRHEHVGDEFPYAHTRGLTPWGKTGNLPTLIRSEAVTFRPPIVLIRRTSRPEDRFRAVGTLITGRRRIAVENHLLAAIPKERTVRACEELLSVLKNPKTSEWLNERIRCRHLTVGAVGEIPWARETNRE